MWRAALPWLLALLALGGVAALLYAPDPGGDPALQSVGDGESSPAGGPTGGLVKPARVGIWGQGPPPPLVGGTDAWMREPLVFPEDGQFTGQRVVEALSESLFVRFPSEEIMQEFLGAKILPECPQDGEMHTKAELDGLLTVAGFGLKQKGSMVMIVPRRQRPAPPDPE